MPFHIVPQWLYQAKTCASSSLRIPLSDILEMNVAGDHACIPSGAYHIESGFKRSGEGAVSVIRQTAPNYYELIETIPTELFAPTMAFDPKTKNIYLLTAEFETVPSADPAKSFSRKMRAGSFCVLVVSR